VNHLNQWLALLALLAAGAGAASLLAGVLLTVLDVALDSLLVLVLVAAVVLTLDSAVFEASAVEAGTDAGPPLKSVTYQPEPLS
jgi:hypothetical protein